MERFSDHVIANFDYEGVNVGAVLTSQGNIAIDAPSYPRDARDWAMKLQNLNRYPTQALLLTDSQIDRLVNARWLNAPVFTHTDTAEKMNSFDRKYPHAMLESLMVRNPEKGRDLNTSPVERPSISFNHDLTLLVGGIEVIIQAAPGPTAGNFLVYVPEAAVLFTGDIVVAATHPQLHGPYLQGWLQTLRTLRQWPHPIQTIVPGHGPLCTLDQVGVMETYLQHLYGRVQHYWQNGRSREETASLLPEFLPQFPTSSLPIEWLKRQIKVSLAHTYDEIKLAQSDTIFPEAQPSSENG